MLLWFIKNKLFEKKFVNENFKLFIILLAKWEDLTPKYTLRTTPKRQLETTTNSDNKPDNKQDLLSKINGINSKPPRSPLTVTSLNHDNKVSAETAPILIKRKRNVAKSTVATQTENSYLASLLNNRN